MAKRGRRPATTSLASLERELAGLNSRRDRVIAQIRHALEHLTSGSAVSMAGPVLRPRVGRPPGTGRKSGKGGRRPGFKMSAAARAKISAAAKKRWAERKKNS